MPRAFLRFAQAKTHENAPARAESPSIAFREGALLPPVVIFRNGVIAARGSMMNMTPDRERPRPR